MLATEFKLIPLAHLVRHEDSVLGGLESLPIAIPPTLLEVAEIRYPLVNYLLLTYWPEHLSEDFTTAEIVYSRLYWLTRMVKATAATHDLDAEWQRQSRLLLETVKRQLGMEAATDVAGRVMHELEADVKEMPVAFSDFSKGTITKQFGIRLDETGDFFSAAAPVQVGALLQETLKESVPLGLAIGTEKARSEFIIAPVLLEARRQVGPAVSLFSGVELDADPAQGLRGTCDFLLCASPDQRTLRTPVVAVVEAKRDDFTAGIGQCVAEMLAARIINEREQAAIHTIHGVISTGSTWKFARLVGDTAFVDVTECYIKQVDRIVGILVSMLKHGNDANRD